jgi:Icc-related predicted phosphoesterase
MFQLAELSNGALSVPENWSELNESENVSYAAVQFLPFGTDERYNSMEIYQKLKKIVSAYESMTNTC